MDLPPFPSSYSYLGKSIFYFGCGVFKALASNNIKIDIVAGTSIGGVNAAIIAGGKQEDHPEKVLEQYWLELAEGSTSSTMTSNKTWSFTTVKQEAN